MEKISVIVPVYNVEDYLEKCISSIREQTYSNLEIILINDGSKDSSGKICDKLAEEDHRIVVIHKENSGVSDTRNFGIKNASGDYLAFIDSDDWIEAEYIEKLYAALVSTKSEIAICGYIRRYADGGKSENILLCEDTIALSGNKVLEWAGDKQIPFVGFVWGKLYRKQLLTQNSLCFDIEIKICEDSLFNYQVFSKCGKAVMIKDSLYNYLIRGDSVTRSANKSERLYATRIVAFGKATELAETLTNRVFEEKVNFCLFESIMIYIRICMENDVPIAQLKQLKAKAKKSYKRAYRKYISCKMRVFFYLFLLSPSILKALICKNDFNKSTGGADE